MGKKFFNCLGLVLLICNLSQCQVRKYPPGYDFDLFKGTPVSDLARAVEQEDTQAIAEFMSRNSVPIDFKDRTYGHSLLFLSVANGKEMSAEKLMDLGADPNAQAFNGSTPFLHVCTFSGEVKDPVKLLRRMLAHGANVNYVQVDTTNDQFGKRMNFSTTPLRAACIYGNLELVRVLVDSGADFTSEKNDSSILATAVLSGNLDMVKYLMIEKGAPIPEYVVVRQPNGRYEKRLTISDILNEHNYSKKPKKEELKREILEYLKSKGEK